MTKNKYLYILIIFLTLLFGTTIYLLHRTCVLNTQLQTLERNYRHHLNPNYVSDKFLQFRQFKEDSYIRQQSHDTDLILAVFAITITFITLATYKVGQSELEILKRSIREDNNRQESKYKRAQDFINETAARINFETYLSRGLEAERVLIGISPTPNKAMSVFLSLTSLTYLGGYYYYLKHATDKSSDETASKILNGLEKILQTIGEGQLLMTGIKQETIEGCFQSLLKLDIPQIPNTLYKIKLKLIYE